MVFIIYVDMLTFCVKIDEMSSRVVNFVCNAFNCLPFNRLMKKLQFWTFGFAVDEFITLFVHFLLIGFTVLAIVGCYLIATMKQNQTDVIIYGALVSVFILIPFGVLFTIYLWKDSRDFFVWVVMIFSILCGPAATIYSVALVQNLSSSGGNPNLDQAGNILLGVCAGVFGLFELLVISRSFLWPFDMIGRHALTLTNNFRKQQGLKPLRWSQALCNCGSWHSFCMAFGLRSFGHDKFESRTKNYPFKKTNAAENVGWNERAKNVAKMAVDGWINSPGHRKNMLDSHDLCGISVWRNFKGQYYLTQLFATRG